MLQRLTRSMRHFPIAALAATAALHAATTRAEDIDLFRINKGSTSTPPNVLFLIDNTANWNATLGNYTKRSLEHRALSLLFDERAADDPHNFVNRLNVGFMVFSEEQPEGGKVTQAIELLDDSYREELEDFFRAGIDDTKQGLQKSNNASYALSMYEAYQYFGGREPRAGGLDQKDNRIAQDPDAFDGDGNYNSPAGDACYNYLVVIGNGQPDAGENRRGTPETLLREIGGRTDTIPLDPDDFEAIVADEYSRFFNAADVVPDSIQAGKQSLRTYVIDVYDPDAKQNKKDRAGHALLRSIAAQTGQGAYYTVTNPEDLLPAIQDVLDEILSVNSVFAATALPVSVNVRGTNLNQVYIGVFRPDAQDKTRWYGNLKLYQLNADPGTGNVFLADRDGDAAQSPETGFIRNGATSFWTHGSTFWDFSPRGEPASGSDAPDGAVVEKGGVAQQLREIDDSSVPPDGNADDGGAYRGKRSVFTCTGECAAGSRLDGTPFRAANADIPLSDDLIAWIRGEDLADEDTDGLTDDARASIHGDVLHSQPAIVNYGGTDADGNITENVVAFYGANDGMIHAIQGGKDSGGDELWAFVPPEFFPRLSDLRDNVDGKTYFADGSLTAYVADADGDGVVETGDKVYLYATMRRGGRFIYALDVTDPDDPVLLWHIDNSTAGFAELGQTWSDVRVGRIRGYDDPVAFFGAGYDPAAEDPDPDTGSDASGTATEGRGLFAVNGRTGDLIWQAGPSPDGSGGGTTLTVGDMDYSTPAAPTPVDRDRDGYLDRVYIPDTGGQVWRVNLTESDGSSSPSLWEIYKLASVGSDQEFQYPVDVVDGSGGDTTLSGQYDAVLIGSGDRENPFDTAVTNRFYMFKDSQTQAAPADAPHTLDELFNATDNTIQVGTEAEQEAAISDLKNADGWYMTLGNAGEKVVGGATTLAGTTFFNTNQPPVEGAPCSANLGVARNYAVSFRDASATIEQDGSEGLTTPDRSKETPGGGFPPSPVPVVVNIDGEQYLAVISGTTVTGVPNIPLGVRQRVFWHRENLDQ